MTRWAATAGVLALASAGCVTAASNCIHNAPVATAEEAGFRLIVAVPPGDDRTMHVVVRATGEQSVQLLVNEWSLTTPLGTSAVGLGAPHRDIQTVSYPTVTLPPGAEWRETMFPRAAVSQPVMPLLRARLRPFAGAGPCPSECTVQLAYAVQIGASKKIGVLAVPLSFRVHEQVPTFAADVAAQ